MKIKRRRAQPDNPTYELTAPWSIACTLLEPDAAGYRAVILDDQNNVIAESIPERVFTDFENRQFQFVFFPPVTLKDMGRRRYRIGVRGPSGHWVPFDAPSWIPKKER